MLFLGCNQVVKKTNTSSDTSVQIQRKVDKNSKEAQLLKKQLQIGASAENILTDVPTDYIFSHEDIRILSALIKDSLQKKGYVEPSEIDFSTKINTIFKINTKNTTRFNLMNNNCPESIDFDIFQFKEWQFYIVPEYRITVMISLLPELIDYKKYYPAIAQLEDTMTIKSDKYGETTITRWKDISNLEVQRNNNWNILFHRNNYLFNENKASFNWLIQNDQLFMESIVRIFGYVEDEDLLKWVIDNNLVYSSSSKNKFEVILSILTNRNCNGNLVINNKALDFMDTDYKKYKNSMFDFVIAYDDSIADADFSFSEKAETIARVLYWCEKNTRDYGETIDNLPMGTFYNLASDIEKYSDEFEKQKYYNLPNFEKYWKEYNTSTKSEQFVN